MDIVDLSPFMTFGQQVKVLIIREYSIEVDPGDKSFNTVKRGIPEPPRNL